MDTTRDIFSRIASFLFILGWVGLGGIIIFTSVIGFLFGIFSFMVLVAQADGNIMPMIFILKLFLLAVKLAGLAFIFSLLFACISLIHRNKMAKQEVARELDLMVLKKEVLAGLKEKNKSRRKK